MLSIKASIAPTARGNAFSRQKNPSGLTFGHALSGKPVAAIAQPKLAREHNSFFVHAGKMKTRKAAAKRYKVTASGKVRTGQPRSLEGGRRQSSSREDATRYSYGAD